MTKRLVRFNSKFSTKMFGSAIAATAGVCFITTTSTLCHGGLGEAAGEDVTSDSGLYPLPKKSIESGYLRVSDTHSIYFHTYGNKQGKPVLFVHGGPGGGTDKANARFFDPEKYYIILVDQRGAGKSRPFASLHDNNTWALVEDFEKIRRHLKVDKWMVFGGSWGSTLGLTYSITHPQRVTEIVLRGIFTLRKQELDWFYEGKGANMVFSEMWEGYVNAIPETERGCFIEAYGKRLRGELGEGEMRKAAKAWSMWEGRTSKLNVDPNADDRFGADEFSLAFARIENHYFTNKGFFERDGWLLEDAQISKIRHIPAFCVQGRYDMVCPFKTAYNLKKIWGESLHFVVTTTGHSAYENDISKELVQATDRFASRKE